MESSAPAWVSWVSLLVAIAIPIVLFVFKNLIIAWITKGVQHDFDVQLETLRASLRTSEELLKSDLREKETEIDSLRNNVLSGSAGRRTLLDKRRFEAVEKIWTAVNDSAQLKIVSQTMAILNYDAVAKQSRNSKMQQFLDTIGINFADRQKLKNIARDERPFVPEIAWAYFSAYTTVLYFSLLRLETLKSGMEDPQKLVNAEHVKMVLKAALPHQTQFIDDQDPGAYYYLLDELEIKLLIELRKILDGKEADQSSLQRANEILSATKEVFDAQAKGNVNTTLSSKEPGASRL